MADKIPFDVDLWKSGKYDVVTRDGIAVKSIYVHEVNVMYPVSVILENGDCEYYEISGRYITNEDNNDDLFLIPRKRKVWIAIEKESSYSFLETTNAYYTKEELLMVRTLENYHVIEVELPHE